MFSLTGKTALVTGGGTGIGKSIAHALSDAGAKIVLVGRRVDVLAEALGKREGATCAVDLVASRAPEKLLSFCDDAKLMPDVVVNAAGINTRVHADDVVQDDWDLTMDLNLKAPFFVTQAFVPHMSDQNWGRIINIASLQSQRAFANGISYGASKGGIVQLTRAMAESWSGRGINVNALAPGFFPTPLTAPVFDDPQLAQKQAEQTAIGRNGNLEDIVGPAVFFASDASRYVTGQTLFVDGGYTAK